MIPLPDKENSSWEAPVSLEPSHPVTDFKCGQADLDDWISKYALTNHRAGMARVFVSVSDGAIAGYYALATGGVEAADAPPRVTKGVPRHSVPVVILARLAVSLDHQRRGLGKALISDALRRVDAAAGEVGVRALLVHAKDQAAKQFYLDFGEFEESPTDPMHLYLLMKDLRAALRT